MNFYWYTIPLLITIFTVWYWVFDMIKSRRNHQADNGIGAVIGLLGDALDTLFIWGFLIILNLVAWLIGALCR